MCSYTETICQLCIRRHIQLIQVKADSLYYKVFAYNMKSGSCSNVLWECVCQFGTMVPVEGWVGGVQIGTGTTCSTVVAYFLPLEF